MPARRASRVDLQDDVAPLDANAAAVGYPAIDRAEKLRPARAEKAGDAEDLAGAELEVNIVNCKMDARPFHDREAIEPEQDGRLDRRAMLRIEPLQALAGHGGDDPVGVEVGAVDLGRDPSVAEDGGPVAERDHLRQPVGDEDHGGPCRTQALEETEELGDLAARERGRRLVEHEDGRASGEGSHDHDQMALRCRQRGHQGARIDRQPEIPEERGSAIAECALADQDAVAEIRLAGEDILRDRELLEDLDFLGHVGNALGPGLKRGMEGGRLAVEADGPLIAVGRMDAVQDLDKGRFTGAVLAEQRVDLAAANAEVDAAQSLDAGKALHDPGCLDDEGALLAHRPVAVSPGRDAPGRFPRMEAPIGRRFRASCSREPDQRR